MRWLVAVVLVSAACGDDGAKHPDAAVQMDSATADSALDAFVQPGKPGEALWARRYGEAGDITPVVVAVDSAGASIYAGYFNGTLNFATTGASGSEALSSGANDAAYLGKLDASGNYAWSKKFTSASGTYATAVAIGANDSVFVAGQVFGTTNLGGNDLVSNGLFAAFVGKFDSAGNHVWSKAFGGSTGTKALVQSASTDSAGNVIVVGSFTGSIDFGNGAMTSAGAGDYFVAKLDGANGNYLWAGRFGDAADQGNIRVAVSKSTGAMNLTGSLAGTVDFGGGGITGTGFIAQLASNGSHNWSKGLATAQPHAIAADGSGNVYYTGYYTGTVDFSGTGTAGSEVLTANSTGTNMFLTKLAASGAHGFSRGFSSPTYLASSAVGVTSTGIVTVTGQFRNSGPADFSAGGVFATPLTCPGARALYAASFTTAGAHRWSFCIGPASTLQEGEALDVDSGGHVFVNGDFYSTTPTMDFVKSGGGTITLTKTASVDAFAAKLEP